MEGVSQSFSCDAVDLVAENGLKGSRLPFDEHAKVHRRPAILGYGKLLAQRAQGLYEVIVDERRRAQVFDRATALGDYLVPAIESTLERAHGFSRTSGKEIAYCLKPEHQALKTLQERIMEFASDARALADSLFETDVQLPREAEYPKPQERQDCKSNGQDSQDHEPPGLPKRWIDSKGN
jgi:hypothetical protein